MAHDTSPHSFAARQADVRNGALIAGERDIDIRHVIKDRRDAVDSDTQVFSPHGDHIFLSLLIDTPSLTTKA